MESWGDGDHPVDYRIRPVLRELVSEQEFDYGTLVAGVHQRAGRIRRRRALVTGSVAAVVVPALGSAALVLPGVWGDPGGAPPAAVVSSDVSGSGGPLTTLGTDDALQTRQSPEPTIVDPSDPDQPATDQPATDQPDPEQPDPEQPGTDQPDPDQLETDPQAGVVQTAPWQDGEPPLPADGLDRSNSGNAWEIPDARPTGVDYLEQFGAPQDGSDYARISPVDGVMACNTGAEDAEPLAGQRWSYYHDDADSGAGSAYLHVTGWQDSHAAFQAIRDDTMTYCERDTEWAPVAWDGPGGEGGRDALLFEASGSGLEHGFAIIRQGDYLIAVTVTDGSGEINADVAAETADRMAQNMAALDPAHGRD